jgi:phospholipase/lecithinase/hemolysin
MQWFSVGRPSWRLCLVVGLALVASAAAAQSDFDRIVFFGDSLSDPGNAFVLTGKTSRRPFQPIPSYPYARGGKHFSNGATWAEQFAREMGMNRSSKPAFRVPGVFTNYAVGGSRARIEGPTHLAIQVGLFAQDFPVAPADALYVVALGGNDVRDAIEALATDSTGATSAQIIGDAVLAVAGNISALMGMGASQFLVGNSPDLGLTPAVRAQGPLAQFYATQFSQAFNSGLSTALDSLAATPGVTIARFDIFQLLTDMVMDPGAFGLQESIVPCLTFYVRKKAFCEQPDDYLFWDGIHPTRAAHAIVAEGALQLFP